MKKLVVSLAVMVAATVAQAKVIKSSDEQIVPSSIDQVIRLVDKNDPGTSYKKLSIVVTDRGMSTDVSPRYTVYLGYASLAEMGNISTDFKLTDEALSFKSATRKAAGIYEVKTIEMTDEGKIVEATYTVDTTQMFIDEKSQRNQCGGDFCDITLKTSVVVTKSTVPSRL